MLSPADLAILGGLALLLFGPDQLPKVARKVGGVVREVQNTSQSFLREMERAADLHDDSERLKRAAEAPAPVLSAVPDPVPPVVHAAPETDPSPTLFDERKPG